MRLQKIQHQRPISQGKYARIAVRLATIILVLVLIFGIVWMLLKQKVSSELRNVVETKLIQSLQETGLTAQLGQAHFIEGQGIQLNDLAVELSTSVDSPNQHSRLEVYEAFIHSPVSMTQLVAGELDVNAIEFRRAKLVIVRDRDGNWDLQNVISKLQNLPPSENGLKPIGLRDCEIQFVDHSSTRKQPISITGLEVFIQPVQHENRELIQINGSCQAPGISKVELVTYIDSANQTWSTDLSASQAKLSSELLTVLPASFNSQFKTPNNLSGVVNVEARAIGSTYMDQVPNFSLSGDVSQLSIDDVRIPQPIQRASAKFQIDNQGLSITNASGELGQGEFLNCNYSQSGLSQRRQWHLDGTVNQFDYTHSPRNDRWLTMNCKKFCKEFSPIGTSDFEFNFDFDGTKLKRIINANLTDMSFSFFKMPYRVNHCAGQVNCVDDDITFRVRAIDRRQQFDFKGQALGIGNNPTFRIDMTVPGEIPIDQKLLEALDAVPKLSKVVRAFQPKGLVGGIGRIEREVSNGPVKKSFDIRLKQCSIRHDHFDYPIHNVNGLIQSRDSDFTFTNLAGSNGSGKVICNGGWNPVRGLGARFECQSIPLSDQLRFALKPEIREIWNGFRPRGTLDSVRVDMTLPINQKHIDLVVEAEMNKTTDATQANYVSIHPVWFPYQINHVVGKVNIGNGEIKLTDIEGQHQKTWVACQGDGRYTNDAWSVKLRDMFVGGLKADEDFLKAIPRSLATPIQKLKFDGLMTVKGELSIAGSKRIAQPVNRLAGYRGQLGLRANQIATNFAPTNVAHQSPQATYQATQQATTLAWDLELVLNQAKMQVGFPIENVFGGIKLVGQYDGQNATCRGDLNIDSLTLYDNQITKISGPIWLDNFRTAAGVFAKPSLTPENQNNISPLANSGFEPRSLTGTMHRGKVNFDAQMNTGARGEFYLQATLEDGCLKTTCRDFGAELKNLEGHSFAAVRMSGDYTGTHSHRGNGTIQLRQAKIYELPTFLSMLKLLKIRQADRTAFDTGNIDFEIQGETIDFKKLEFLGDAISLIGNGKMNLDWDIDLNFYSIIGRNRINIPLISELYRAGSQKALWINVTGKLDNPQTNRHVLPQLNDSLQQIFQPQASSTQGIGLANRFDQTNRVFDIPANGSTTFRSPSPGTWFDAPTPRESRSNFSGSLFR